MKRRFHRIIYWFYQRYINEIYIPRGETEININRYPNVFKDKNELDIQTLKLRVGQQEHYFFNNWVKFTDSRKLKPIGDGRI